MTKLTAINGQLYYNGELVLTVTTEEALLAFIDFLKTVEKPVLVGHNIRTFDLIFPYCNLTEFVQWDHSFVHLMYFMEIHEYFNTACAACLDSHIYRQHGTQ